MQVYRCPENPIIGPKDVEPSRSDFEVIGVFNAGVARLNDQVILLLRVAERVVSTHPEQVPIPVYDVAKGRIELINFDRQDPDNDFSDPRLITRPSETYLTSISHLRLARSTDGVHFEIDKAPAIQAANEYETFGVEDPRITKIDETYYITYVGVSPLGVTTMLASTKDFNSFERHGVIFCPENKDALLFPEMINGKYYALHRPVSPLFKRNEIWIAESPDLVCWGNHRYLMGSGKGSWDDGRIGASCVPVKLDQGWLEIYHGADKNNRYCLGAVLFDADEPYKIIARSHTPTLEPQTDYECEGFFGNVVFSCGLLAEQDKLKIYYGVADTSIAYAEISIDQVLADLDK
jgi:predicted GH43/DUF377 family glycosyl hydrolase